MPKVRCAFCGEIGNRSVEHLIPQWFSRHVNHARRRNFAITQEHPERQWKSKDVNLQTSKICERCNNQWMSRIENEAKAPISRMISGKQTRLDSIAQLRIVRWLIKTAFVADLNAFEVAGECFFTESERHSFFANPIAVEGTS